MLLDEHGQRVVMQPEPSTTHVDPQPGLQLAVLRFEQRQHILRHDRRNVSASVGDEVEIQAEGGYSLEGGAAVFPLGLKRPTWCEGKRSQELVEPTEPKRALFQQMRCQLLRDG